LWKLRFDVRGDATGHIDSLALPFAIANFIPEADWQYSHTNTTDPSLAIHSDGYVPAYDRSIFLIRGTKGEILEKIKQSMAENQTPIDPETAKQLLADYISQIVTHEYQHIVFALLNNIEKPVLYKIKSPKDISEFERKSFKNEILSYLLQNTPLESVFEMAGSPLYDYPSESWFNECLENQMLEEYNNLSDIDKPDEKLYLRSERDKILGSYKREEMYFPVIQRDVSVAYEILKSMRFLLSLEYAEYPDSDYKIRLQTVSLLRTTKSKNWPKLLLALKSLGS